MLRHDGQGLAATDVMSAPGAAFCRESYYFAIMSPSFDDYYRPRECIRACIEKLQWRVKVIAWHFISMIII